MILLRLKTFAKKGKSDWTAEEEAEWETNTRFTEPMKKCYKVSRAVKDTVAGLTGMATGGLLASAKSKKGSHALVGAALGATAGVGLAKAHRKLTGKNKKAEELIESKGKEYNELNKKHVKRYRAGKPTDWNLLDKMSDIKNKTKKEVSEL